MSLKEDVKTILAKFNLTESDIVDTKEETVEEKEGFKFDREKFEDVTLLDGTVIMVEPAVEVGAAAAVMSEEVAQPLPVGEYELTDGKIIVVEDAGLIAAVNDPNAEAPEEEVTEELAEEDKVKEAKRVIESIVTEKVFNETIAKFNKEIEGLTEHISNDKTERVEFMKEVLSLIEKIGDEPKEEPTVKKFNGFKEEINYFTK